MFTDMLAKNLFYSMEPLPKTSPLETLLQMKVDTAKLMML